MTDYTLLEMFYSWEAKTPERVFLSQPHEGRYDHYTWHETGNQVRQVAYYLHSLQLPKNAKIGVFGYTTAHWVMAELAILMAGYIVVPIHYNIPPEDFKHIVLDSGLSVLFTGKLDIYVKYNKVLPDYVKKISLPYSITRDGKRWEEILQEFTPYSHSVEINGDKPSYLLYSAGTTGLPRGIIHSMNSLGYASQQFIEMLGIRQQARLLSQLSLTHISTKVLVQIAALYTGSTIFFSESKSTLLRDIRFAKPYFFLSIPHQWNTLKEMIEAALIINTSPVFYYIPVFSYFYKRAIRKKLGWHKSRLFLSSEESMPDYIQKWYRKTGIKIIEMYGQVENAGYAHINLPSRGRIGTVGKSVRYSKTMVSKKGAVIMRNEAIMLGYHTDHNSYVNPFTKEGFLKTGDIGELDKRGYLKIIANEKDLIRTNNGKYLAPAQIEKVLIENELISQVCLIGNGLAEPLALIGITSHGKSLSPGNLGTILKGLLSYINSKCKSHQLQSIVIVPEEWSPENGLLTPSCKPRRYFIEEYYAPLVPLWLNEDKLIVWSC